MGRIGKTLSFGGVEEYQEFERVAKRHGRTASGLCQAISRGEVAVLSLEHLSAVKKGVIALLEGGDVQAARLLSEAAGDADVERLGRIDWGVVEGVFSLVSRRHPFRLTTVDGQYRCRYADLWTPPGERPQLRAWVEEVQNSDEPAEVSHNQLFCLDCVVGVEAIAADWRFEGLDSFPVVLEFRAGYSPIAGDQVEAVGDRLRVTRPCWSVSWLLQDISRYGNAVTVLSPNTVRNRVIATLESQLAAYQ